MYIEKRALGFQAERVRKQNIEIWLWKDFILFKFINLNETESFNYGNSKITYMRR